VNHRHPVVLVRRETHLKTADLILASTVFCRERSRVRVRRMRAFYGDALTVDGSGVDVRKRLPVAIEALPPDTSLYLELADRGIGFPTRGCPFRCPFCIVPEKEGKPRQFSTLDEPFPEGRKKLIFLADNNLARPRASDLLEEKTVRGLAVNFTQTLDPRLVDEEKVGLLKRNPLQQSPFHPPRLPFQPERRQRPGSVTGALRPVRSVRPGQRGVHLHVRLQHDAGGRCCTIPFFEAPFQVPRFSCSATGPFRTAHRRD